VLADLDSANGTFVNGQRIQRHTLRNGDEIRIGDTRISFGQEMRQPSSV
jgi:pSer/pThr/pTyr-binding forkhead associated (FHA) protein